MVPSSMMMAWTDGNDVWSGGSHCTDSIMGMLGREKEKSEDHCICSTRGSLFSMCIKVDLNIYPFTRDKLSSKLVLSVRFGTLLRPSVTFTISCSTLLQEPVNEEQEKCCKFKSFDWLLQSLGCPNRHAVFFPTYLWQGRTRSVNSFVPACLWYISNKDKHTLFL